MTTKNVYGKWMDTEKPVTGVTTLNHCPDWVHEELYNAIDPDELDFQMEMDNKLHEGEMTEEEYDNAWDYYEGSTIKLIGDWLRDGDMYNPDPDGEYSAI